MKTLYSRELEESDLETIKVFDQENLFPYLLDPFTFKKIVIEDDKGIILVGMRRVINEFKIIPNNARSNLDIVRAIKAAFDVGVKDVMERCPTDVYVFITRGGEHYVNILKKHIGFTEVSGIPLRIEV